MLSDNTHPYYIENEFHLASTVYYLYYFKKLIKKCNRVLFLLFHNKFQGLYMILNGKCETSWSGKSSEEYSGSEYYVTLTQYFIGAVGCKYIYLL